MLIYLDTCCLKRPFDDQSILRNHLESEAVLALLAMESEEIQFARSEAMWLENSYNSNKERAARVEIWISAKPLLPVDTKDPAFLKRVEELLTMGFRRFDAIHAATAEHLQCEVIATSDDKFIAAGFRNRAALKTRIAHVINLAMELLK